MGATKTLGCFVFLIFSSYLLLQAERGRRFLVGERETAAAEGGAPHNPAISQNNPSQNTTDGDPVWWMTVGINVFLVVATFLCYDLVVANVLVLTLATDTFFMRAPLRLMLFGMVCVLAVATWHELPLLQQTIQQNWMQP